MSPAITWTWTPPCPGETAEAYAERRERMLAMLRRSVSEVKPPPQVELRPLAILPPAGRIEV